MSMNKPRLLTPGPTMLPEEVRLTLARQMIHHRKSEFVSVMQELQGGLQTLFATTQQVLPLSCSGTGAMQAAVSSLFSRGESVLALEAGKFGQRWSKIARSWGLNVIPLELEWGQALDADRIAGLLQENPQISGLLVQASETSTGVLHPVQDLGQICREQDVLLVVDGISAVGISPCPMDRWEIDCLLTGSQKGLMLPPGLALISLSPRAQDKASSIPQENFYFNLLQELDKANQNQTQFTSAVNLLQGLRVCLQEYFLPSPERIMLKHWALCQMTRQGVSALGLQPLVDEHYTWGLTSVLLPQEVSGQRLLACAKEEHNVILAGGQDRLKGRILRIGHMGYVDWGDILAALQVIKLALQEQGCTPKKQAPDYLEQASQAYFQAWQNPPDLLQEQGAQNNEPRTSKKS
ncbi:MAG: pyridoxal-phosphate-dependent aminotransferase family protein [Desulfohalobiaceae bacterium]